MPHTELQGHQSIGCCCSNPHNDVPQVAQLNISIVGHIRHRSLPVGSEEEDLKVFSIIYGYGGHIGHVTWTYFHFLHPWKHYMKFGYNLPCGFG